ncbi:MAG: TraX family protein [Eubacteriales bacterium]|nr:TraX family protein [Eubacteriales bacterium]
MNAEIIDNKYRVLNRDVIKYIAMFTMLLNHIASVFMTPGTFMYAVLVGVGFFTAITLSYFLVEGYDYTHSKKKYLGRLFLFALISEIPYCLAATPYGIIYFMGFNILFSLCICFGILYVMENVKNIFVKVCLILIAFMMSMFCDWMFLSPTFTLLFIWGKKSEKHKRFAFILAIVISITFRFYCDIKSAPILTSLMYAVMNTIGMVLSAICILFLYNGKRVEKGQTFSKWFFYLFYPVHLLIIGILRILIKG